MRNEVRMSDIMGAQYGQQKKHLDGCNFRFFEHYKLDKEASEKTGYSQHVAVDFIEIVPQMGDRTVREVKDKDRLAYPEQFAKYEAQKAEPKDGYWLKAWPFINKAELADLEAFGLKTVEEVAALGDEQLRKVGFLKPVHKKAKNWLKSAKSKQADCTRLQEKLDELENLYNSLKDQHALILQRIESAEGNRML